MKSASFIAGDWGTTNLRLFLCDGEGEPIDTVAGPGAKEVRGDFAGIYDSLTSAWLQHAGPLPAILCGLVGSSFGWRQTEYVPCPATAQQIARSCVQLRDGWIRIVPGVSCSNRLGAPDVMRGEETQTLGALQLHPDLREGRHLLCAPGTHTKWIVIESSVIKEMLTAPTGELFGLICDHSVLVGGGPRAGARAAGSAFKRGLAEVARHPHAQLLHRIFECRSRPLRNDLAEEEAASYLSGLLIASDVRGALELFADVGAQAVHVIGSKDLTDLYGHALASADRGMHSIDGHDAARAGLAQLRRLLVDST